MCRFVLCLVEEFKNLSSVFEIALKMHTAPHRWPIADVQKDSLVFKRSDILAHYNFIEVFVVVASKRFCQINYLHLIFAWNGNRPTAVICMANEMGEMAINLFYWMKIFSVIIAILDTLQLQIFIHVHSVYCCHTILCAHGASVQIQKH